MSAPVPWKRSEPPISEVQVSAPVRAQTWRELGSILHWIRAHGMHVVPAHSPQLYLTSNGVSEVLHYRVKPQGLAITRVWAIQCRQEDWTGGTASSVEITLPSGQTATTSPVLHTGFATGGHVLTLREDLAAKSAAQVDLDLTFEKKSGTTSVWVESVTCYELPRAVLTLGPTDEGVDFETLRPGATIFDSTNRSVGAVAELLAGSQPRRSLWQQAFPDLVSDPGAAANPTAWVDLLPLPVPILPSRDGVADSTHTIAWDVYAAVSAAPTTFEVRITTTINAVTDAITIAGVTSPAWHGPGSVAPDCEDPTTSDGLPLGGLEGAQVAVRRTAGAGSIAVGSLAAWEP